MRLERTGSKTPAGGVNEEVNQIPLLSGGNPSGMVFPQDLQDPWSILHAYRESYILGVGQVEFRPEHVAPTLGYEFRVHFPSQSERVF
jgi:hypothetical protein